MLLAGEYGTAQTLANLEEERGEQSDIAAVEKEYIMNINTTENKKPKVNDYNVESGFSYSATQSPVRKQYE